MPRLLLFYSAVKHKGLDAEKANFGKIGVVGIEKKVVFLRYDRRRHFQHRRLIFAEPFIAKLLTAGVVSKLGPVFGQRLERNLGNGEGIGNINNDGSESVL